MSGHPRFERAFVAMSYWLGALAPRDVEGLGPDARALARALGDAATREARAAVLAKEVTQIVLALDRGGLA